MPSESAGHRIRRDEMYFTVWISEMYLAANRQWWSSFDPLVVVVSEFNYGSERVAIPKVIGPNLIQKQNPSDTPRHGTVMLDTSVVGPHPYRGGEVVLSIALYQVERVNHARVLLNVVESLSTSLGAPGDIEAIAKTGSVLLQGIEGLLGLEKTSLIAGARMSLVPSPVDPLSTGFAAVVAPPAMNPKLLRVVNRRLAIAEGSTIEPYAASDFVLVGVTGGEARGDENCLPFYPLKLDAVLAVMEGDSGVTRGKASLLAAYQQMRKSPDVTNAEASRLFETWLREFEEEKQRFRRTQALGDGTLAEETALSEDFARAASRLGL